MEQKEKSWFVKNWKWAVPVGGCGCGCLGIVLLFVFGIGAAFFGLSKAFDESMPIKQVIELLRNNEKAIDILGNPIERAGIPEGNISLESNSGEIDFSIPVEGSKANGTLIVRGIKVGEKWIYEDLYLIIRETQEEINLLKKEIDDFNLR